MEQYDDAVIYSKKCIDLAKTVDDKNAEMKTYVFLRQVYLKLEQYDDVVIYSKKCIDLVKETKEKSKQVRV
jgi:hypothetical protein